VVEVRHPLIQVLLVLHKKGFNKGVVSLLGDDCILGNSCFDELLLFPSKAVQIHWVLDYSILSSPIKVDEEDILTFDQNIRASSEGKISITVKRKSIKMVEIILPDVSVDIVLPMHLPNQRLDLAMEGFMIFMVKMSCIFNVVHHNDVPPRVKCLLSSDRRSPSFPSDKVVDCNRVRLRAELDDILHKQDSALNFVKWCVCEKIRRDLCVLVRLVVSKVDESHVLGFIQKPLISELDVRLLFDDTLHLVDVRETVLVL
jgi:hypothetical protein